MELAILYTDLIVNLRSIVEMMFGKIIEKATAMSNRVSQDSIIYQVRTIMEIKITILIITMIMKRKHKTKQN